MRKLLMSVFLSWLLYGVSFWSPTITAKPMNFIQKVTRHTMLKLAMYYRTVSYVIAVVVLNVSPLSLLKKRTEVNRRLDRGATMDRLLQKWQQQWNVASKGRQTYRLISNLRRRNFTSREWYDRTDRKVNFYLKQAIMDTVVQPLPEMFW